MKAEQFNQILQHIETEGKSLRASCIIEGFKSTSSFFKYLEKGSEEEKKEKREHYAHAMSARQEKLFDEILDISDDSSGDLDRINEYGVRIEDKEFVNRSKLRVDARKWALSKMNPKKYGDKVDLGMGDLPKDSKVSISLNLGSDDKEE